MSADVDDRGHETAQRTVEERHRENRIDVMLKQEEGIRVSI